MFDMKKCFVCRLIGFDFVSLYQGNFFEFHNDDLFKSSLLQHIPFRQFLQNDQRNSVTCEVYLQNEYDLFSFVLMEAFYLINFISRFVEIMNHSFYLYVGN